MIVTQNNGFLSVSRNKQGQFVPITTVNAKPIISELIEKERAIMFETKRDAAQRYGAMCLCGALHPITTLSTNNRGEL